MCGNWKQAGQLAPRFRAGMRQGLGHKGAKSGLPPCPGHRFPLTLVMWERFSHPLGQIQLHVIKVGAQVESGLSVGEMSLTCDRFWVQPGPLWRCVKLSFDHCGRVGQS